MRADKGRLIRKLGDDVGLDQSGSGGGDKTWFSFKYILNVLMDHGNERSE